MKTYTWVEWKEKFKAEANGNKQKQHDSDCTALVTLEEAQKLEGTLEISDELLGKANDEISLLKENNYDFLYTNAFLQEDKADLEKKISEANKILDEINPQAMLPIQGNPAIFRTETEYEKGDTEGFYRMRNEALGVLDDLIKRLRMFLDGETKK